MHPQMQGEGSQTPVIFLLLPTCNSLIMVFPGLRGMGLLGVCVSGALYFLSLHHPPQIQLWQLLGIPSKRWGLLLCQSPELDWVCGCDYVVGNCYGSLRGSVK